MGGALLVLALTTTPVARVMVPAIETDASMEEVGARLREHLSRHLEHSECVEVVAGEEAGPELSLKVAECGGDRDCLDSLLSSSEADVLLQGTLESIDGTFHFRTRLLDPFGEADPVLLPDVASQGLVNLSFHLRTIAKAICEHFAETEASSDIAGATGTGSGENADGLAGAAEAGVLADGSVVEDLAELDDLFLIPEDLDPFSPAHDLETQQSPNLSPVSEASEPSDPSGPSKAPELAPATGEGVAGSQSDGTRRDNEASAMNAPGFPPLGPGLQPVSSSDAFLPEFVQRRPLAFAALGAGALSAIVATSLGLASHSVWAGNASVVQDGLVHNSITREDALRANRMAVGANVLFGVAGACAVGGAALFFLPTGDGVAAGGRF